MCGTQDNLAIDRANDSWMKGYNQKNAGEVQEHYTDNAIFFAEKGVFLKGNKEISNYYTGNFHYLSVINRIVVNARYMETLDMVYEIGCMETEKKVEYPYIVIWTRTNGVWLREFEMVARKTTCELATDELNKAREKWMRICNSHDAQKLVDSMYTREAYYYNRGRVLQGRDNLSREYSYMNDIHYCLTLEPASILAVQSGLVFEIGKCSGTYNGHYVLKWEKEANGEWMVSLDSNY